MMPKVRKTPKMKRPRPHLANRAPIAMLSSMACSFDYVMPPDAIGSRRVSPSADGAADFLLDIRQLPHLVEELLLRGIEAGHQIELARGIGRYPVRLLAGRRGGPEIDIDRAILVLLQLWNLRGAACARHVPVQRMRLPIISGHRPVLFNWHIWRNVQAIGLGAVESIAVLVPDR